MWRAKVADKETPHVSRFIYYMNTKQERAPQIKKQSTQVTWKSSQWTELRLQTTSSSAHWVSMDNSLPEMSTKADLQSKQAG